MRRQLIASLITLFILPAKGFAQDVHPEVQAALDWKIPTNECELRIRQTNVGGMDRRSQKAIENFAKCNVGYLDGLIEQQSNLMAVARHGLTQEQADIIMGYIVVIKRIVEQSTADSTVPE